MTSHTSCWTCLKSPRQFAYLSRVKVFGWSLKKFFYQIARLQGFQSVRKAFSDSGPPNANHLPPGFHPLPTFPPPGYMRIADAEVAFTVVLAPKLPDSFQAQVASSPRWAALRANVVPLNARIKTVQTNFALLATDVEDIGQEVPFLPRGTPDDESQSIQHAPLKDVGHVWGDSRGDVSSSSHVGSRG